jgi:hypothetical protein
MTVGKSLVALAPFGCEFQSRLGSEGLAEIFLGRIVVFAYPVVN